MPEKRYPRDRSKGAKKHKPLGKRSQPVLSRFREHPLFGGIPLLRRAVVGSDGKRYEWWECDPDYQPALPRDAIAGDVRKQEYCHGVPRYFYMDEERKCIQCDKQFVFRAKEQKYWYETLKFNFHSVPIRCLGCRRQRRSEHSLREQIARAKAAVRDGDPAGYLALARAIVEYHERTLRGNLDEAIAAARKAAALLPDSPEPQLWEGIAHAQAGRARKAQVSLRNFLMRSGVATLRNKAERYLTTM
jgi:Probable zinc-ribbon domain